MNPFDTNAVEEAIRLKERFGGHVTAVSMGPPAAVSVLRKAISHGVDEGILLSDRVFGGADTLATSTVIGLAIKKVHKENPVDIILCGKQTIDGDTAQVGPGIARRMDIPQLTLVNKIISADESKKILRVSRKLETYSEVVETTMPALITVEREINTTRYPTVPGRIHSRDVTIKIWDNKVLNLDPNTIGLLGSPTQVRKIFAPERKKGEVISGEGEQKGHAVDAIVELLVKNDIIITK